MKTHRKPPGYVEAPQYEMPVDGGFRLITDEADDGERICREREEEIRRRDEFERAQLTMF